MDAPSWKRGNYTSFVVNGFLPEGWGGSGETEDDPLKVVFHFSRPPPMPDGM